MEDAAALRRSSVARRRASRASSSEVCVDTAFFLQDGTGLVAQGRGGVAGGRGRMVLFRDSSV